MSRYDDYEYSMLYYIKGEYQRMYDVISCWDEDSSETNVTSSKHYLYGMGWAIGDIGFFGWRGEAADNERYHYEEVLWYYTILKETLRNLLDIPSRENREIRGKPFSRNEKFANTKSKMGGMIKDYQAMFDAIKDWDNPVDLPEDHNAHFANLAWYLFIPTSELDDARLCEDIVAVRKAYVDLKHALQRAI